MIRDSIFIVSRPSVFRTLFCLLLVMAIPVVGKEVDLDNGNVTFDAPDDFTPLTQAEIAKKFPMRTGFMEAVGNDNRAVSISYSLTDNRIRPEQLTELKGTLTATMTRLVPNVQFLRNDFLSINGTEWIILETTTPAQPEPVHNIEIVTSYRYVMLVLNFNATVSLFDSLRDKLWASVNSVKIKDNALTRQPLPVAARAPVTPYEEVARGDIALHNGHLTTAEEAYTSALLMDPQMAEAQVGMGQVNIAKTKYDEAVQDFTTAIDDDPNSDTAYRSRAEAEEELNQFDTAAADIDKAVALKPNDPKEYTARGNLEIRRQNYDQARADFNQALDLNEHDFDALRGRGELSMIQGDYDAAFRDFQTVNDVHDLAYLNLIRGKQDNALLELKTVVDAAGPNLHTEWKRFLIWTIKAEQNHAEAATMELSTYLDDINQPKSELGNKTGSFLVGKMSEPDLIAYLDSDPTISLQHLTDVWYLIGMKRQIAGDSSGAGEAFHKCVGFQVSYNYCFLLARARLQGASAQGPWYASPLRFLGLSNERMSIAVVVIVGAAMLLSFLGLTILAVVLSRRPKSVASAAQTRINRAPPLK